MEKYLVKAFTILLVLSVLGQFFSVKKIGVLEFTMTNKESGTGYHTLGYYPIWSSQNEPTVEGFGIQEYENSNNTILDHEASHIYIKVDWFKFAADITLKWVCILAVYYFLFKVFIKDSKALFANILFVFSKYLVLGFSTGLALSVFTAGHLTIAFAVHGLVP